MAYRNVASYVLYSSIYVCMYFNIVDYYKLDNFHLQDSSV